ncbi:MAG: SAM-dependent methyltransferase [Mucilaginibacter sp.]|nr:SAM-dependent methyltransferase [Mucilaginibacter sp.]
MFKLRLAKDLLLHRFKAKNRHGLHSPFVYRLVDTIIYDFYAKKVYAKVKKFNKNSKKNNFLDSPKVNRLIYRLANDLKPDNLIELGPLPEITKVYLQKAAPTAKLYTDVNGSPEKLDFVIINEHDQEQALKYFEWCLPKVHENTMLVFTGIYQNKEMKQAWTQIKAHPKVTVTVDLFWIGLVFFRKGQVREDFWIKF